MTPHDLLCIEIWFQGNVKTLRLSQSVFIVGRSESCGVPVPACKSLSREHLKIEYRDRTLYLTDLNSVNGTYIDGKRIPANSALTYSGQSLYLGAPNQGIEIRIAEIPVESEAPVEDPAAASVPVADYVFNAPEPLAPEPVMVPDDPIPALTEEAIRLSEQVQLLKLEVSELEVQKSKLDQIVRLIATSENRERELIQTVEQLEKQEQASREQLSQIIDDIEQERKNTLNVRDELQREIEEWEKKKLSTEDDFREYEGKVIEIREALKGEEKVLHQKILELKQEQQKNDEARDYHKNQLDLEMAQMVAESKLKRTQIECEIEEARHRNLQLKREYDRHQDQLVHYRKVIADLIEEQKQNEKILESTKKATQAMVDEGAVAKAQKIATEQEIRDLENQKVRIRSEMDRIELDSKNSRDSERAKFSAELELLKTKQEELMDARERALEQRLQKIQLDFDNRLVQLESEAREKISEAERGLEAKQAEWIQQQQREENKIRDQRSAFELEMQQNRNAVQLEIEELRKQWMGDRDSELAQVMQQKEAIELSIRNLEIEQQNRRTGFEQEQIRIEREWRDQMAAVRERDLQEQKLLKAEEETRIRTILAQDSENLVHQVVSRALLDYRGKGSVSIDDLLKQLEQKMNEALGREAKEKGIYQVNLKRSAQQFWLKAGATVAAGVLVVLGAVYGPELVGKKIAVLKVLNQQENQKFMQEVREQRDRMLALKLEVRSDFQESYVDNILYNPGYLAVKENEKLKKEWTVVLSKFFFEELLFDDRKVVDYLPIETALIRGLSDYSKVLNTKNFSANLRQMKEFEEKKVEEMWLLVGGRDNWLKLRVKEAAFFRQHIEDTGSDRVPATATNPDNQ